MGKRTLKVMHGKDIDQMSSDEIREKLKDVKMQNMTYLAQVKSQNKPIEHPSRIRENRKMIARMMTVLVKRGERCVI